LGREINEEASGGVDSVRIGQWGIRKKKVGRAGKQGG